MSSDVEQASEWGTTVPFQHRERLAARPSAWSTPYIAFTISSTIFFASANSIMVLSRKKSSFSMPA